MSTAPVPVPGLSTESAPEGPPSAPPAPRHPLSVPHFRDLWIGSSISLFGDQFYLVALPWLVLQLTGSSLALGTILMASAIPRAALMLVGGVVTDRVAPRRVLLTTAAIRMVLVGVMTALIWLGTIEIWHLYVLTVAFGLANAFSIPAVGALIPSLVLPQQLQRANVLLQSSMVVTQMIGQAPAGLIIKRWGIPSALLFDTLSFLAVIVALFRIPEAPRAPAPPAGAPARPSMVKSIREGLRSVWNDPPLRSLMLVFATINICVAGPIGVGLAGLARFQFASAAALGTLLSCFSGGTLGGVLLCSVVKRPRRRGLQLILVGTLAGLVLVAIGLSEKLAVIGALLALMGLGVGFINVQFSTWIQMRVDRALLGRVSSVLMVSAVGLVPVSYAVAGVLAQWSLKWLFIGFGALLVTISVAIALTSKPAREID